MRQCCYASSVCHMFCSSAQHRGREKKRDIFVAETTRESRSPIQRKRKRLTLIVILSALLSCAPERLVWTLPRNDWWARNAGDTIDIGAWPDSMFMSTLRMSKTTFMLLCEELGPFIRRTRDPTQVKVDNQSQGAYHRRLLMASSV